jgi:uncharacterized protein (TIGR03000 family)
MYRAFPLVVALAFLSLQSAVGQPSIWDNYYPNVDQIGDGYNTVPRAYLTPRRSFTPAANAFYYSPDGRAFYYQPSDEGMPVQVNVQVPSTDAQVWFDGTATRQQGAYRTYQSPALPEGNTYSYEVRVRWMENGNAREETRTIRFRAGQSVTVDFTRS